MKRRNFFAESDMFVIGLISIIGDHVNIIQNMVWSKNGEKQESLR